MTFQECPSKFLMPLRLLALCIIMFLVIGCQFRQVVQCQVRYNHTLMHGWIRNVGDGQSVVHLVRNNPQPLFSPNVSPKFMHMLCKVKQVKTKSGTFFKCTSTLFKIIRHLPLSIPNARSTHMRVELCTKFQWYFCRERPSLWPLNRANIQEWHGYAASPTTV